jgi:hypothetical protein
MDAQRTPEDQVFETWPEMEPDTSPLTHQEIFSAVHHHASSIARLTSAVPAECKPALPPTISRAAVPINAVGRWVGEDLWWDIEGESISDHELKRWCYLNLPEPWNSCITGIVNYHTAAYKHRRDAIREYLK